MRIKTVIAFLLAILLLAGCASQSAETQPPKEQPQGIGTHYALIQIRDYGTIRIRLEGDVAPITVQNFIDLANSGFYNGLTFHRIIEGFMMQGGDPNADGTGGSDKNIKGEFSANGVKNPQSHTRGAVSMARQGYNPFTGEQNYDTASSQFFIVHQDSPFLDGQYAVFGYVTEGMDIVDAICAAAQPTDNNGTIAKDKQPIIGDVEIYQ